MGNNLAVRLPAAVVGALKLREGDEIESTSSAAGSSGLHASQGATNY
jgi:antitoxin component of MazEF toxin-antitoxin module